MRATGACTQSTAGSCGPDLISQLGFDAADRLASIGQTFAGGAGNVAWAYGYTPADQIASSGASTGQFDWAGSAATSVGKTYDGLNRDTAASYDANGNLTSDGVRSFAYDGDNRLVSESGPGIAMTLAYDPTGRLARTVVGGSPTNFIWDGQALSVEYDDAGDVLNRYTGALDLAMSRPPRSEAVQPYLCSDRELR